MSEGGRPTPSVEELLDHLTHANNELVTRVRDLARRRAAESEGELAEETAEVDDSLRAHLEELLEAVRQVDAAAALPRQASGEVVRLSPRAGRHLAVVRPEAEVDAPVETGHPSPG